MKKRTICVLLIGALLLSMTSCGNRGDGTFPEELSLDTLYPILNEGRATLISSTAGGQSGETAGMLIDGNLSTKLCTNTREYVITWKLNCPYKVGGYVITTANDSGRNGRLPRGWMLEASTDGEKWTIVSNIINSRLEARDFTDYFYSFSEPGDYQYFRFTLTASSRMTQMAEITLYGPERAEMEKTAETVLENKYASAGIALLKNMIGDYYDRESHTVFSQVGNQDAADLWGVVTFLEALAEGYRLYPEDTLIYNTYVDVLNFALTTYRVNRTIETPNGQETVVFYDAYKKGHEDYRYDYNAAVCIQYLNAYNLLGEETYLRRAEDLLDFLWTGWNESRLEGGIYTDKNFDTKSTASNAPVAVAFFSAYEITKFDDYLQKGKTIYTWCQNYLMENNLYCDSISRRGEVNAWKGAYNQGTMLVAGSLLYRITNDTLYLQQARATYNAAVELMFDASDGYISMNGDPIYKACSLGWLERGFILYQRVTPDDSTTGTDYMHKTVSFNMRIKDGNGYYDPYFRTGAWKNEPTREVTQPSGVASAFLLAALYETN